MGKVFKALLPIALTVGGYIIGGPIGAAIGSVIGATLNATVFKPKLPKTPLAQLDRLNASLNPTAPRTGAFGETALGTDIRYIYPSGTDQRYIDYIIGVACHKVESIDELWIEDRLAWSSSSGYASWTNVGGARLTVATRTKGTSGNAINIGGAWTGSARLTGCAYIHVRIDRQGTKKTDSPFSGGLASRITIKGKGMPLYDPRLDTTRGGSGSHRADDQTTWATTTARNNPALQILAYLIGWKIAGKLSVGRGVPLDDIDFDSFITAANACDEDIDLAGGGTQNRYETAGMFSEGDDADTILNALAVSCNAELRDYNGRIGLFVKVNDLAVPVASFSDQNILSGFRSATGQVLSIPNVIRGRYTDPSNNALYQLVDYPEVSLTSVDGIERVLPLDLPYVQEGRRAQRIAKQALQRAQYSDTYEAEFDVTALKCGTGDVVEISFEALGWTDKLFRVISQSLTQNGRIAMQLRVEDASIYAWEEDETAPVTAAAPTTFDPLNAGAILAAANPLWDDVTGDGKPEDGATQNAVGSLLKNTSFEAPGWTLGTGFSAYVNTTSGGWGESEQANVLLVDVPTAVGTYAFPNEFHPCAPERPVYWRGRAARSSDCNRDLIITFYFYDAGGNILTTEPQTIRASDAVTGGVFYDFAFFSTNAPTSAVYWRMVCEGCAGFGVGAWRMDRWYPTTTAWGATNGADWSSNVTNRPTELTDGRVLAGLNSDGTIKAGKVGYTAMSADVLQEIVSATASNITATDTGAVMLSLEDVTVKPSQGGYVHLILTSTIKLAPIASPGGLSVIYARLQRSPANAGTWTEVQSWLLGSAKCPTYIDDGVGDAVDDYEITIGAAAQYIDVPGSDGDYDYRWLASKTSYGTGSTPASTSAGIAQNAQGIAISTKVAV